MADSTELTASQLWLGSPTIAGSIGRNYRRDIRSRVGYSIDREYADRSAAHNGHLFDEAIVERS